MILNPNFSTIRFLLNFTPEKTYIMKMPHCFKVSIIQAINWKSTDLFRSTFSWLFAYVVWLYISIRCLPRKEEIISILEIRGKYLIKLWCHFVSTTNTNETGSLLPAMVICISSFQLLLTYKPLMIMEMIGQIYLMMISLILSFAKDFQEFYFLDSAMKSYVQPCTLTKYTEAPLNYLRIIWWTSKIAAKYIRCYPLNHLLPYVSVMFLYV